MGEKGLVLVFAQNFVEKLITGGFFFFEHIALAATGIDELCRRPRCRGRHARFVDATSRLASAMRGYLAEHQNENAAAAAKMLLDVGPDDRQVNSALVDYARYLRKLAADQADQKTAFAAMAEKLATRKEYSLGERIFLGSVYRDLKCLVLKPLGSSAPRWSRPIRSPENFPSKCSTCSRRFEC